MALIPHGPLLKPLCPPPPQPHPPSQYLENIEKDHKSKTTNKQTNKQRTIVSYYFIINGPN